MVDSRCYDNPGYFGKIGQGQSRKIIDEIVSLSPNEEYTILHIGCGSTQIINFDSWLRSVYYTQFSEETHVVRGENVGLLCKRVNYILSDVFEKNPGIRFRSNIAFYTKDLEETVISGTQEYLQIDAKKINYADSKLDIVLALGFFSNAVLKDSELEEIVLEISRVLKPGGFLITSVHEHYVDKLIYKCKLMGFTSHFLSKSKDLVPDAPKNPKTRHLYRFEKLSEI